MGSYWLDATTVLSDFAGYVYSIVTKPSLRYLGAIGNLIGMTIIHIRPMLRLQQLPSQEPAVPTTILAKMQDQRQIRALHLRPGWLQRMLMESESG